MSEQANGPTFLRVNTVGFGGPPASLYGAMDADSDILVIASESEYDSAPREGLLCITTQDRDASYDALFLMEFMREAIMRYFEADSMRLLTLQGGMARHDPRNAIELDGMDDSGKPKYRTLPGITNGQVGVLIACYYGHKQRAVRGTDDFFSDAASIHDDTDLMMIVV